MKQPYLHLTQQGDAFILTLSKTPPVPGPGSVLSKRATIDEMRELTRCLLPGGITVSKEKGQPPQATVTPTDVSAAETGLADALEWYYLAGADFTWHHDAPSAELIHGAAAGPAPQLDLWSAS